MFSALFTLIAPLRRSLALGAVILIILLSGMVWAQQKRLTHLAGEIALITQRVDVAEATNQQLKANAARELQALVTHYKTNQARIDAARQREREIRNVDPKDDAPCAPVLCGSLERMRDPSPSP